MLRKLLVPTLLALAGACAITWFVIRDQVVWSSGDRIAWRQDAVTADELARLRWEIAVDAGSPVAIEPTCSPVEDAGGYDCHAPLPRLPWGRHTLLLRTWKKGDAGSAEPADTASAASTMDVFVLPNR